ncbi:hypothetical protein N5U14_01555 [Aliarcobacter butzleri]|uniref:hypothetical protein n=1 Tax=Aliarcobacter butzleri TaxID=28197 RepID=UPI0021B17C6B|nr:hypothetical protein [Aliarcobacter butzleri]MCT7609529.1 hypothetical protein [Aliarcobacter butzleri]
MKKLNLILMIFISLNLQAEVLTKEQLNKLNSQVVNTSNNIYFIEEYNRVNFIEKIVFDGKNLDNIVIKTKAMMQKDVINKEQFIAISSSLSSSIVQSIFMVPQYFTKMKSIELLSLNDQNISLNINLEFTKDGINTIVSSSQNEQRRFLPYSEIFYQKLQ